MIAAYPDKLSYLPGECVKVMCSTDHPSFRGEVRLESRPQELVRHLVEHRGLFQEVPAHASSEGCGWRETFTVPIDHRWPSGVYSLTLHTDSPTEVARALFAVRPRVPSTPILLVLSTNTYNAYNDWGGPNLYEGGTRVSFMRPLAPGLVYKEEPAARIADISTAGLKDALDGYRRWAMERGLSVWSGAAGWWNWERRFFGWAEKSGFRMDVATNADLEFHPEVLDGHRLVVSVGHDEYWSWGMRDNLESFIGAGGNVAFFSGNAVCWQIRYEDDGNAFVAYKYFCTRDPVVDSENAHQLTSMWSDRRIGRPENELTGVSFTRGGYVRFGQGVPRGSGGYTVWRPEHWALEGTGVRYGDQVGMSDRVVAYEADGCDFVLRDGLPTATHTDGTPPEFEILATSPAHLWATDELPNTFLGEPGDLEMAAHCVLGDASQTQVRRFAHGNAVMGMYTRGGTVFTTGCTDWSYGLDRPDPVVERITANVLERLSA